MIWNCQWLTLDPPHCFYKTIDAFSGCLYPQPRYIFPPTLRAESSQTTKSANQPKSL
jgi:hypothetical protein